MNIKKEKTFTRLGDIEIQKQKIHQHKGPISLKNISINKIVVSNKACFGKKGFKYFIGYTDAKKRQIFMYICPQNECIQKRL